MKIDLKISNREKMLLIILGITIIAGGYYRFVYSKQIIQIKELTAKKAESQGKIDSMEKDKALNDKLKEDIVDLNEKVFKAAEDFFPSIKEEKITVILDGMLSRTNIKCDNIAISETSDEALPKVVEEKNTLNTLESLVSQYKVLDNKEGNSSNKSEVNKDGSTDSKGSDTKDKVEDRIKKVTIGLSFNGAHNDVMRFIDEIKGFQKRIIIRSINISAEGDNLSGSMILDFYAVPKFIEEDIDYNKWSLKGSYGKNNMFKSN